MIEGSRGRGLCSFRFASKAKVWTGQGPSLGFSFLHLRNTCFEFHFMWLSGVLAIAPCGTVLRRILSRHAN